VIRSSGIIETSEDKTITYLGGHNIDSDALTPEIRTLYNELITKLGGINFEGFKLDDIHGTYSCPLTPLDKDLITPKMILILNNLLSSTYTVDKLPVYKKEFPITADRMDNWVMKGIQDGKPFVAIKMKHTRNESESKYVVFLTSADKYRLNTWTQCPLPQEMGKEVPSFFIRDGVQTLLANNGKLDDPLKASEDLKLIIQDGLVQDHRKKIWEVIGHPKVTTVETSPADNRFSPAIREIFSNLGINVDTLPVLENSKEELPKPEDLNAPIMKFTSKGSNHPNIAIKLRCENENATSLLILGKEDADKWSQRQREDFGLYPRFFNVGQFTNEQGKLVAPANSIAELKKILAGGEGNALNGKVWKLAK
jgi:hypothetical protein